MRFLNPVKCNCVRLFVVLATWGLLGCGVRGQNQDTPQAIIPQGGAVHALETSCGDLRGKLGWPGGFGSLHGLEVWLLNHRRLTLTVRPVAEAGTFYFECALFAEEEVYSLHIVRDQRLLADIDFSAIDGGVQGAIAYAGGLGLDLGTLELPSHALGQMFGAPQSIAGQVGGGFRVLPDISATLSTFGQGEPLSGVTFASELIVTTPRVVSEAFYQSDRYPQQYARELARGSRITMRAQAARAGDVRFICVEPPRGLLQYARLPDQQDAAVSALYWSDRAYAVAREGDSDLFAVSVFPGTVPRSGDLALLQVYRTRGGIAEIPLVLKEVVGFPPRVKAFATGPGSTTTLIDYASNGSNGLTKPFCQTSEVRFVLEPPRNAPPAAEGAQFLAEGGASRIDLHLDYYPEDPAIMERIPSLESDFDGAFAISTSTGVSGTMQRAWNPQQQQMTFTRAEGLFGEQTLAIPQEILLDYARGIKVGRIRLRIRWSNGDQGTAGGTILWLQKGC